VGIDSVARNPSATSLESLIASLHYGSRAATLAAAVSGVVLIVAVLLAEVPRALAHSSP
jgi:hypothetical protein